MTTYLDVHILQTVPPSNLNRDDSGSPKTATYGGVRRARVSSQAWKRAVRKAFEADPATAEHVGLRTRRLPQVIADRLADRVPDLDQVKDTVGLAATNAMFKLKLGAQKDKRPVSEYLLFLGEGQLSAVVDRLADAARDLLAAGKDADALGRVVAELGLAELGMRGHAGSVALFGRMVANAADVNVDAACQVAHAISTHQVETEFDYFTAVDDHQEEHETGAGMIGTVEFNSATLYRYATVDLDELVANLDGEVERALEVASAFSRAFALSMPTGKQNTFAHGTRPDFIMLTVRVDQPVNLVGAFERPVFGGTNGLVTTSLVKLVDYWREQDRLFGTPPVHVSATYPEWLGDSAKKLLGEGLLPGSMPLAEALASVRTALAERVSDGGAGR